MTETHALVRQHSDYTREQLDLLKRTLANGTTDDEFALFIGTAKRLELDPFMRQIHPVKRRSYDKAANGYVEKMVIQVGIDGFRAIADRTGQSDGQDGPYWCGPDGKWIDVWLDKEPPVAAKVTVYKRGCSRGFTGVATYRSYAQTDRNGTPNRQWTQMADVMLAKCAEALALRKAHPAQLSGVYAPEEMDQADNDNRRPQSPPVETRTDRVLEEQHAEAAYGMDDEQVQLVLDAIDSAESDDDLDKLVDTLTKLPDKSKPEARKRYAARVRHVKQQQQVSPQTGR
jgi:phage recombination protein Bet